jgi:hypothetical protein
MNKDSVKIKYLIGAYLDSSDYPTYEDFYYLINHWYYHEGGSSFMHEYRGIEDKGNVCFPSNILLEKVKGDEQIHMGLLDSLLKNDIIQVMKKTRFGIYYEIINNQKFI